MAPIMIELSENTLKCFKDLRTLKNYNENVFRHMRFVIDSTGKIISYTTDKRELAIEGVADDLSLKNSARIKPKTFHVIHREIMYFIEIHEVARAVSKKIRVQKVLHARMVLDYPASLSYVKKYDYLILREIVEELDKCLCADYRKFVFGTSGEDIPANTTETPGASD